VRMYNWVYQFMLAVLNAKSIVGQVYMARIRNALVEFNRALCACSYDASGGSILPAVIIRPGCEALKNKRIDCVIFDLDGTIADTIPMIVECFQQVFQKYAGRRYSISEITAMFGPTEQGIILSRVPQEKAGEAIEYFYENYSRLLPWKARLFDGVDSMLYQLQSSGKKLGIGTGKGKRSTSMTLIGLDVHRFFPVVVTGDDVQEPKPSPKILAQAVDRIGSPPEHTMYVGDTPVDIMCGKRLGVFAGAALWGTADREALLDAAPDLAFEHPNEIVCKIE